MSAEADRPVRLGLWRRGDCVTLAVLAGAWCVGLALASAGGVNLGDPVAVHAHRVQLVRERIDPNTASVASLRRAPLIGKVKARAIVAFRQRAGKAIVFRRPEDLTAVHGIGPGTARRAAEVLSWPEASSGVDAP